MIIFCLFLIFVSSQAQAEKIKEGKYQLSCYNSKKKGMDYSLDLEITEKGHYIHPEAPLSIEFLPSKNYSPEKSVLKRDDALEKKRAEKARALKFPIRSKAGAPPKKLEGLFMDLSFFICSKDICVQKKNKVNCSIR